MEIVSEVSDCSSGQDTNHQLGRPLGNRRCCCSDHNPLFYSQEQAPSKSSGWKQRVQDQVEKSSYHKHVRGWICRTCWPFLVRRPGPIHKTQASIPAQISAICFHQSGSRWAYLWAPGFVGFFHIHGFFCREECLSGEGRCKEGFHPSPRIGGGSMAPCPDCEFQVCSCEIPTPLCKYLLLGRQCLSIMARATTGCSLEAMVRISPGFGREGLVMVHPFVCNFYSDTFSFFYQSNANIGRNRNYFKTRKRQHAFSCDFHGQMNSLRGFNKFISYTRGEGRGQNLVFNWFASPCQN